ncbi:hypothetical protein B0A48_13229 [Cryoendolithus antarcticus]|uniref:Uncharacterized protein n=1 Tax=Cryoendolithus antarcticus TaxID=1507870 RepID=A0A1V8SNX4_9PEZI|nr:hypothetical protein B0A48_13229 [Cryoendolithus antarcticus]
MNLNITTGDIDTRDGSNVQIGVFGLMGSASDNRRAIQMWIAPWLFESYRSLSQAKIWEQRREASRGDSGTWFTGSSLEDWLQNGSDCLWLYGESRLNLSESCLNTALTDNCSGLRKEHAQLSLAFTFFAWDLTYTHSKTFVARTLLALLSSIEPLLKEIKDAYEKVNSFETVDALILIRQIFARPATNSSVGRVTDLVLVVDAIDEIPSTEVRLQALAMLKTLCTLARSSPNYRLRVILTSRYGKDVEAICSQGSGWSRRDIPTDMIKVDMKLVLEARMREIPSLQDLISEERYSLSDKIIHKSGSSFRLASMYMDALVDSDLEFLEEAQANLILDDLPSDLFAYYDRILARIQRPEVKEPILSALRLLLFAAEPLTVEQLVASCASMRLFELNRHPVFQLKATDLVRLLNGLVEPPYSDDIRTRLGFGINMSIRMKHFSVVEWLRRPSANFNQAFFHGSAPQRHITLQCFASLTYCHEYSRAVAVNANDNTQGLEQFSFARYAAANWFLHAAAYFQINEASASCPDRANNSNPSGDDEDADYGLTRPTAFALRVCSAVLAPGLCSVEKSNAILTRLEGLTESFLDPGRRETLFGSILKHGLRPQPDIARETDRHDHSLLTFVAPRKLDFSVPLYPSISRYPNTTRFLVKETPGTVSRWPAEIMTIRSTSVTSGRLVAESLENKPKYIALTYAWAMAYSRRGDILRVNDQTLPISEHLSQWLDYWQRDERLQLPVWIDAISIDMRELGERTQQIQLMGPIYSQAATVVVWLGQGTEHE